MKIMVIFALMLIAILACWQYAPLISSIGFGGWWKWGACLDGLNGLLFGDDHNEDHHRH